MNHKDLIEKVLPYLKAYKGDLEYQLSCDINYLRSVTNGTPMFGQDNEGEAEKEAEQYVSELKALIEELDKAVNKTHQVTITGSISTTVTLKAKDEEEAIAKAHADFQKNLGDAHDYVDWLEETVEEVEA